MKHIEPEGTNQYSFAKEYMENRLMHHVIPRLKEKSDSYELLFEAADIFHCLRRYKPMMHNAFKATMAIAQDPHTTPELLDNTKSKLITSLQTYYSKNNLCYSAHYAEELWGGIVSKKIREIKHLNKFLDERKIAIDPNITFISMRLRTAPQLIPTQNNGSISTSTETTMSSDISLTRECYTAPISFASKMLALKGYPTNGDSFVEYERNKSAYTINMESMQQRSI